MTDELQKLVEILRESKRIVFFGGAGVSTESGIPDFRSANGLWNEKLQIELTPEQLVSHTYFERFPKEFFDFYRDKLVYPDAKPNGCHKALARLEEMGKLLAVVTQNIDGLHQAAGSKTVYELHGSVLRNYCMECHSFYDADYVMRTAPEPPKCEACGGIVKPDVVLYEEALDGETMQKAADAIGRGGIHSIFPGRASCRHQQDGNESRPFSGTGAADADRGNHGGCDERAFP